MVWDAIWSELRRMQRQIDSLFSSFRIPRISLSDEISEEKNFRRALTDFSETEKEYVVEIELPGIEKENIKLDLTDKGIEIRAEKKGELKKENKERGEYKYMKSYAGFYQAIDLPENADKEKIDAVYKNGVLTLKIPKKEIKKGKEIKIK